MNSKALFDKIKSELIKFEEEAEAEAISYLILENIYQISRMDILIGKEVDENSEYSEKLESYLIELKSGKPIQHIMGRVEFYGRQFLVNSNVLIPRRETEELVHLILEQNPDLSEKTIIDIGTGSGIIPITIAKERKESILYAVDISSAAIATAKRNAQLNRAEIQFIHSDILSEDLSIPKCSIWISNPPYVRDIEKNKMHTKVLDYEPDLALFVEDNSPLIFYKRITKIAFDNLLNQGKLYFEINEAFGSEVQEILHNAGFGDVIIKKDMQGKDRFVYGTKSIA
ncbi:peptide chain release factor N(5)-glutamine methyltransferase [Marivirga arenosa]|uniref:peptide chain release factor N(5)-glutamine methyltransferase n=1 Tax=Marivirga arenosa TaxID=3059076 RepID=A0AA49GI00_9BACT|nr:peptide chain release factor N(5)-glutamine methyltransferase [Marivirga sp. ABR2-2]WKK85441.2 peptide chain release factor N(5)-glutamine methyltransferase [Marivirga sp. ABR2-2]